MIKLTRRQLPSELIERQAQRRQRLLQLLGENSPIPDSLASAYRDSDLKGILREESYDKCIYCESKVSHVYFGDVEHIVPRSIHPEFSLDHDNLGLACAICNNNKSNYWDPVAPLLNPYVDNTDEELLPFGPMLLRQPGRYRAELTIKQIDLNRTQLIERRMDRIDALKALVDVYVTAATGLQKEIARRELLREAGDDREYALIVRAYIRQVAELLPNGST